MKTKKIIIGILLVLISLAVGASEVSAGAIGDDYQILGYNAGWVFLAIGIVGILLFASKIVKMPKGIGIKIPAMILAFFLVIGAIMIGVTVKAPTANIVETGLADMTFDVEESAISGYTEMLYDKATGIFTVPFRANTTSDAITYATANSTTGDPVLNFTIKPEFPDTATDEDLSLIYYEVVNPSLYVGQDPDDLVLTKTDNEYQATWTDQNSATSMVSGWTGGGITTALTVSLTLDIYGAGLAQADEYDTIILNLNFHNKANTWSESFQVAFVCTASYA